MSKHDKELMILAADIERLATQRSLEVSVQAHSKDYRWLELMSKDADAIATGLRALRGSISDFYDRLETLELNEKELIEATELRDILGDRGYLARSHVDSLTASEGSTNFSSIALAVKHAIDQIDKKAKGLPVNPFRS